MLDYHLNVLNIKKNYLKDKKKKKIDMLISIKDYKNSL